MKILWISEAGYSCDLALDCVLRGHQVKVWIMDKNYKQLYDGILEKVDDWAPAVSWCDYVVFDHSGMSKIWKEIYKKKPCFGGSEWADKLEKDRTYAHKVFEEIGLKRFESVRCKTISEAIAHVKQHKVRHVVKPVGKDVDSHNIIISEDESGEDAIALLEGYEDKGLSVDYLEIEERKEGIEVGVSVWCGGRKGGISGPININFEHKRYATGYPEGIGPLTGEMGTALIYQPQDNPFYQRTLKKLEPLLMENDYRGQLDLSFIVDKKGTAWPLEATPRLGYPACMIEADLQITPWAELFYGLAVGNGIQNQVKPDWAIGVVVLQPGFPLNEGAQKLSKGIPVLNLKHQRTNSIHLCEVEYKKRIITAPGMGYPLVVTGTGKTIQDAKRNAYYPLSSTNPKRVRVPNSFWRIDIGDRVIRQLDDIHKFGIVENNEVLSILQ